MLIIRKNPKLGNFVHFEHGWEAVAAGFERVEVGTDGEGLPIYENGDQLFSVDWNEAWGEPPTDEELEAWEEPEPEPASPLTAFDATFLRVQKKLDGDEYKRTGKLVDPSGAVSRARAYAATAMILAGYLYPSEGDLATGNNPAILAAIYADPESRTTADSPTPQKQSVLHFTLVMLVGQQFGLDYQAELGAYERTASPAFRIRVATDSQAWLDLPCGPWASIRAMFLAVMA